MNKIQTKPFCASSLNLADMLTMVNPIDFGGHSSKVKVTRGIIDECGVRGDATLCVVIFTYGFEIIRILQQRGMCKETTRNTGYCQFFQPACY